MSQRLKPFVLAAAIAAAVAACATATSPTGRTQYVGAVSQEQLNQLGAQAFAEVKSQKRQSSDARQVRYVQCVVSTITRQLPANWQGGWDSAVFVDPEPNAFALPGGKVGVYSGIFSVARNQDQLAGVIAHEIGHVAHRDGTRSVLQAAGLSFLFGMVLGDFVGGWAVVMAAKALLQTSYSREVERRADAFGVDLANRVGSDGRALGAILVRIEGASHPGTKLLLDHPDTRDRLAAINAATTVKSSVAPLDPAGWAALKRICAGP